MARPAVTPYRIKNPEKYIGPNLELKCRSSWEMMFCKTADENKAILRWGGEGTISISYFNVLTNKWAMYLPDFLIIYIDKNNKQHIDLIEIKPSKETPGNFSKGKISESVKMTQLVNHCKFTAAQRYCASRGWTFRIVTEKELFKTK